MGSFLLEPRVTRGNTFGLRSIETTLQEQTNGPSSLVFCLWQWPTLADTEEGVTLLH